MLPLLLSTQSDPLGPAPSPEQRADAEAVARAAMREREALGLPTQDVAEWLATLDTEAVEQGCQWFWTMVRTMRVQKRREDPTVRTNPLTLGGESRKELAAYFRRSPGRPTLVQVLGVTIAQAMLAARIAEGVDLPPDGG